MRTIEVFHLKGTDRQLIARMCFLNDKDFKETANRLTTSAPFNTLRRERHEACHVRVNYSNGFEDNYHTDRVNNEILNICTEYSIIYAQARKLAQKKGWLYAWFYSTKDWQHFATLKQMRKARKLLRNDILHRC